MSARDEFPPESYWAGMCDEIDRLRAELQKLPVGVSIEQLVALWNTVHSFADGSSDFACTAAELRRRLRSVKP